MFRRIFFLGLGLIFLKGGSPYAQEVLRGEVRVDLEPVYAPFVEVPQPPDIQGAHRRALEEAALFYSAMIYGWSFYYDIGEKARGIAEVFELTPEGAIEWGDGGLYATDAQVRNNCLYLYTDYRLNEAQKRRVSTWKSGTIRSAQATGHGPLGGPVEMSDWITIKSSALEDAARTAVRAILRGSERNRPKEGRGFISLAAFPRYWIDGAQWAVSARFRVEITEIVPFAAY
ncbi:MAG: hypothetical protein LBC60_00995 [Spirochaetaceae bacterium]|jgi:hypothetical protein|nr:hypothetical protein [Spirochaetaceae bacterium]